MRIALFWGRPGVLRGGMLAAVSAVVVVMSGFLGVTASQAATVKLGTTSCYTNGTYVGVRVNIDPCRVTWYNNGANISGTLNSTPSSYEVEFQGIRATTGDPVNSALISQPANKSFTFSESFGSYTDEVAWEILGPGGLFNNDLWIQNGGNYSKSACPNEGNSFLGDGLGIQYFCHSDSASTDTLYLVGGGVYPRVELD